MTVSPTAIDRAERISYNALPATLTSDMWAHQYLQQVSPFGPGGCTAFRSDSNSNMA